MNRYTDQTQGENTEWEMKAISKLFPNAVITKITDKDQQFLGADYKVDFGKRSIFIDTKIHHWSTDIFVYECYDTRPTYCDYGWTNRDNKHITNYILWIEPYYNIAYLYDYNYLLKLQDEVFFKFRKEMRTKHFNGDTVNKYFRHTQLQNRKIKVFDYWEKKPYVNIKMNKMDLSEYLF